VRFLEERASVFIAGLDRAELDAALRLLRQHGRAPGIACDVSREADVAAMVAAAGQALGRVDVSTAPAWSSTAASWR